ncbi:MAG: 16S rRNA (uracil(1498)-N(3))-methyltransferase [Ekhidna sp.]|nr:16S rRNA (uracil(1498)-N(3))-methyltransferase [Ekhidna sp.]MBC6427187.1 16S rRNA (uracil(1498)-N(3))-methyltransferase [Ekhidna sp.]
MNSFYHKNIKEGINLLPEAEAKHCIQVFKHKVGDELLILDGVGGMYKSKIINISKKVCEFEILASETIIPKSFKIHLAIAPTKNTNRMEWLVEKLTEMGVDEISLIQTKNSERKKIRMDRLEKKVLSALKQSKNPFLPKLNDLIAIDSFLSEHHSQKKLIAHVNPGHNYIRYIGDSIDPGEDTLILIGPEGDFTETEIDLALKNEFQLISLGPNTLRTETAGLVACYAINLVNKY